MGLLSVAKIKEFILLIKNPDKLLDGCERYHTIEPRDIAYLIARKIILENLHSEYNILAGIEVLLLTWNAVYLQRQPMNVREKLEEEILEAYREVADDFSFLKNEKLESANLDDVEILNAIKRIFKSFASRKSIEKTGASKSIHLVLPKLFMMWDNEIKAHYHKLHPFYGIKSETTNECYIEFMKNMQTVAQALVKKKTIKEICNEYHNKVYGKDPQLVSVFPSASMEPLPKMLDECNFVRFRKRISF